MNNDYESSKFKDLLDKLQQDSWQLELLISGFAIFGLFSAIEPIQTNWNEAKALESYSRYIYPIIYLACHILIINLVIHVLLRGLWIGAIGLRYVSNDIEYDELNYGKRFTNYLKLKVGSFDNYIGKLENYCSILFAITFLSLFYLISFFIILLIVLLSTYLFVESGLFNKVIGISFLGFFNIIFLLCALFVFIDFITLGGLKRKEWSSFLYMPIYKLFSFLTFSFLYRPLVYNFLDNKFGRRVSILLAPIYALIFYTSTLSTMQSNYLSQDSYSSKNYSRSSNYLNLLKDNEFVKDVAISSKIIEKPHIRVFIPFKQNIEDILLERNQTLKPQEDRRGIKSSFSKIFSRKRKELLKKDSVYTTYLETFNSTYEVSIDSLKIPTAFLIANMDKQLGFETVISLKNTSAGRHNLVLIRKKNDNDTETIADIPFWYFLE